MVFSSYFQVLCWKRYFTEECWWMCSVHF